MELEKVYRDVNSVNKLCAYLNLKFMLRKELLHAKKEAENM